MYSLISAWKNSWVNNGEAGDLKCHCAHYDITVMNFAVTASLAVERFSSWQSYHCNCLSISECILTFTSWSRSFDYFSLIHHQCIDYITVVCVQADKINHTKTSARSVNTLRPRQNCCHFADDIFKCIFVNENVWISRKISLNFVPKVQINNIPALVQIMAWCRPGDKPLSEAMMVNSLIHICVTRPQWVNHLQSCSVDNKLHYLISLYWL